MFSCKDATDRMTDEREGAPVGFWYHLHVLMCPYCRTCRRQLDGVVALARETAREEPVPDVESSVVAALRARTGKR